MNTYQTVGFTSFINKLGYIAEVIEDKFDANILNAEINDIKGGKGTRVVEGMQADSNIFYLWKWIKITKPDE